MQDPFEAGTMDVDEEMDLEIEGLGARRRRRFVPKRKGAWEWLDWPYWDRVDLATGASSAEFFKVPYGGAKTRAETNLGVAGQITDGSAYWIQAITFSIAQDNATLITDAEMRALIWTGYLELAINSTTYFAAPLSKLGWGGGVVAAIGAKAATTVAATTIDDLYYNYNYGVAARTAVYQLRKIIIIPKNVTFEVTARWEAALTLTTTPEHIICGLEGQLIRAKRR